MHKNKLIMGLAMTLPFLASIFYFKLFDGHSAAPFLYLGAKIFILVFPLFFIKKLTPFKKVFKFDKKELLIGTVIGLLIFAGGLLLLEMPFIMDVLTPATPFIKSKITSFGVVNHYLLMALVISFIHSMLEEYYWRWFVFGVSKKIILSAIAFSLHHFIVLNYYFDALTAFVLTVAVAAGGVLFNIIYNRKKNVWGAWAAHVGADLFIFYTGGVLLGW